MTLQYVPHTHIHIRSHSYCISPWPSNSGRMSQCSYIEGAGVFGKDIITFPFLPRLPTIKFLNHKLETTCMGITSWAPAIDKDVVRYKFSSHYIYIVLK